MYRTTVGILTGGTAAALIGAFLLTQLFRVFVESSG
jgi:hypothetical protein